MTAHLTLYLERALMDRFGLAEVSHGLLGRIQRTTKGKIAGCVERYGGVG
jgi:DNA polymerase-3 subunit epsilon